jgi:hypothetical protein
MNDMWRNVIKRMIRPIVKPLLRRSTRDLTDDDVWARTEESIPFKQFGAANVHDWPWYLEGASKVEVASPKEIVDWLRGCRYVGDSILFNEKDFWQHPVTFENMRKGDCEDHALWAWRKLKELGIPAEFVCGRGGPRDAAGTHGHAWVHLDLGGQRCLMETVADSRHCMTFPLDEVRRQYCPAMSVDTDLKTYRYGGFGEYLRLELEGDEKMDKIEKDLAKAVDAASTSK